MAVKTISQNKRKAMTLGMHDAVIYGDIVRDIPSRFVFIESDDDLDTLTSNYPVGTVASEYGFAHMWQLASDSTWVVIGGDTQPDIIS